MGKRKGVSLIHQENQGVKIPGASHFTRRRIDPRRGEKISRTEDRKRPIIER